MTRRRRRMGGAAAVRAAGLLLAAAVAAAGAPRAAAESVLYVGHSLVGPNIPDMLRGLGGRGWTVDAQIINGAALKYNWIKSLDVKRGVSARAELPSGRYEVLVLAEAVPLDTHMKWNDSFGHAKKFYDLAVSANPEARVFLYETWHDLRSGTGVDVPHDDGDGAPWRVRLERDFAKWRSIVDHVNASRAPGQPEMRLIPAGQAMARMSDAIAAGEVPGMTHVSDLFKDNIHPTQLGAYFLAVVHYAAITGRDPAGLPRRLSNRWGKPFDAPSPAQAAAMQRIAREAVTGASRTDGG